MTTYPNLLSPLSVKNNILKNRIVSTAHNINWENNGLISDRHVDYQARKARGGAGLIMCFGGANVYEPAASNDDSAALWNPENEPQLRKLSERVHAEGALIMAQASHLGLRAVSYINGKPAQAPSAVSLPRKENPRALTREEIRDIVEAFADAARRLERCGWDGMEITSFGCHLLEQFWSPKLNRRTDEYGGSPENRARITLEVVRAVAAAVSPDFIIGFRLSAEPQAYEEGLTAEDMLDFARRIDFLGLVDLLNISGGSGASAPAQAAQIPSDAAPLATYLTQATQIAGVTNARVLYAGRMHDPAAAEAALERGDCDLVAMTRAIIADPDMPRKLLAGRARMIRPCIAINDACIGRAYQGYPMKCAVNPAIASPELDVEFDPAAVSVSRVSHDEGRDVLVVGAGPAGLAAALSAAERGHRVRVVEKTEHVGGQLHWARRAAERPRLGLHIDWLRGRLNELGVPVVTGQTVDHGLLERERPDTIILATGARQVQPPETASITSAQVMSDLDVLMGDAEAFRGRSVVVYDRDATIRGGSIASRLADAGALVELYTPLVYVGANLDPTQQPPMMVRLEQRGIPTHADRFLVDSVDGGIRMRNGWSNDQRNVEADVLVTVGYREARTELGAALSTLSYRPEVLVVGDAVSPRRLYDAVSEGAAAGIRIGELVSS